MRYSPSTGCFYPPWGNYGNSLPIDLIEVPEGDLSIAMNRTSDQKVTIEDGRIKLVDIENKRSRSLEGDLLDIDVSVSGADREPFSFMGHTFYPDTEFIQGIFSALPYLPADYVEVWKTAEKEADGITNVYVTLDKTALVNLGLAYLNFKKGNWTSGENQKKALKQKFLQGA